MEFNEGFQEKIDRIIDVMFIGFSKEGKGWVFVKGKKMQQG